MRFPAARVTDLTACPMFVPATPPIPHIGGPIIPPCCPTVLTGGLPQARVSDQAVCAAGGPATIVTGAWNVLVDDRPAARILDMTSHGGRIITGMPTVLIGTQSGGGGGGAAAPGAPLGPVTEVTRPDGSVVTQVGPNITIEGTEAFRNQTLTDLRTLGATDTGNGLLTSIQASGNSVTIVETNQGNACGYANGAGRFENADGSAGAGTDATVYYNPNRTQVYDGSEDWHTRPPAVGLGHELIHAEQATYGRQHSGSTDGTSNRERQAVGLPPYENNAYTENNIREEMGEPERPYY
ncbi:hypothetical protein E1180_02050 [Roseibium denhamense]|uniref:Zn-binding Pro-Ala-Ala-Arg (PAAR) domain-containing protein, incolved in TypeVI secretion n=1 Tax=Roseibium denhamense TaxID=76305 RepID=A0ABY1NDQ6_9HYPH|nr:M91 family zinc metallopeptidase [Roseibium denhamense]MTI04299.1 hypothetical protein [Roseibium denhamense]SMP07193.1 Zn-binding Pro-Ala-Ala-Arg (PAAR) domain-containing protein, incolved in TypeVI secretion [Roseibium denhamense]